MKSSSSSLLAVAVTTVLLSLASISIQITYLDFDADFTLYEQRFFRCTGAEGSTCPPYQIAGDECLNLFEEDKVGSFESHGNCFRIYNQPDCQGSSIKMLPKYGANCESGYLCKCGFPTNGTWVNRVVSIKLCDEA